jgi:peptidoglycan/LPS O-acetylase OafA/YrhL
MIVLINNAAIQTNIFLGFFLLFLILSIRPRKDNDFFPISVSQELKGLAILAIVFAHVAYALVSDNSFLYPLSIIAGVGVDLFLILSGYGLAVSALKKELSKKEFYKKRLLNLYIPFWICLVIFFILDYLLLKINYGGIYIVQSFFGFFNRADLYLDVNSPFWYFTWIIFYYLIFPWLFIKKYPWFSAVLVYLLSFFIVSLKLDLFSQVNHLHRLHLIAFPLGIILAWLFNYSFIWKKIVAIFEVIKSKQGKIIKIVFNFTFTLSLFILFIYLVKNSGVGQGPWAEELVSVVTSLVLLFLFLIKKFEIKTLYWLGVFSYGIYIFHWPLMYRYDFLFAYLPAWLSLIIYLFIFIILGYFLDKLSGLLTKLLSRENKD